MDLLRLCYLMGEVLFLIHKLAEQLQNLILLSQKPRDPGGLMICASYK